MLQTKLKELNSLCDSWLLTYERIPQQWSVVVTIDGGTFTAENGKLEETLRIALYRANLWLYGEQALNRNHPRQ